MQETLYRRPLPADAIAFSSESGRQLFAEALAAGGLDGYFRLAEQFHTQSDPAFCGLGSLVVALNALGIDPGRLWKGPWRWFSEELLDCCVALDEVKRRGLDLSELGCLARCNGAEVELRHADSVDLSALRAALDDASRGRSVLIAAYDRRALGQTGSGHFSPIGGYHAARDLVLLLDVARFKYPPHWVATARLFDAMLPIDEATGRARGWLSLRARQSGASLGFSVSCDNQSYAVFNELLLTVKQSLEDARGVAALVQALAPLAPHVEQRTATLPAHRERLAAARAELASLSLHERVRPAEPERADVITLLLLAIGDLLVPAQRAFEVPAMSDDLKGEVSNLRSQLGALWMQVRARDDHPRG
ncbi:MAG: phytochelatin synthase family protein [Polyangiaceae bacterium]